MARPYSNGERLRMCEELMRRGATCTVHRRRDAEGREVDQFQLELGDLVCRSQEFFECVDMMLDSLFEAWGTAHARATPVAPPATIEEAPRRIGLARRRSA